MRGDVSDSYEVKGWRLRSIACLHTIQSTSRITVKLETKTLIVYFQERVISINQSMKSLEVTSTNEILVTSSRGLFLYSFQNCQFNLTTLAPGNQQTRKPKPLFFILLSPPKLINWLAEFVVPRRRTAVIALHCRVANCKNRSCFVVKFKQRRSPDSYFQNLADLSVFRAWVHLTKERVMWELELIWQRWPGECWSPDLTTIGFILTIN